MNVNGCDYNISFLRWKIFPFYPCDYRDPVGAGGGVVLKRHFSLLKRVRSTQLENFKDYSVKLGWHQRRPLLWSGPLTGLVRRERNQILQDFVY